MLSASQVTRLRQIIEAQEQILRKMKTMLQRDGIGMPGMLDMRVARIERDLVEMEKLVGGMSRIAQDALMARYAAAEGIRLHDDDAGAAYGRPPPVAYCA